MLEILTKEGWRKPATTPNNAPVDASLRSQPVTATQRWFAYVQARPPGRLRLYCLPCAGAGASVFRGWRRQLGPDIEVHPIQAPGRQNRLSEQPYSRLDSLTADLAPILSTDKPYALLGHSTGALIAFGLARRLHDAGAPPPVRLFIVAYRAPHLPCHDEGILKHELSDEAFLGVLREFQHTPDALLSDPNLLKPFIPAARADIAISETYQHHQPTPLDIPISAFGGTTDPIAHRDHIEAWQQHTARPLSMRMIAGGHFLLDDAGPILLAHVRDDLQRDLEG
jgi:medium-chain acyl-[acyl-carrier-protein] hydrolase